MNLKMMDEKKKMIDMMSVEQHAVNIRKNIVKMVTSAKSGHPGGSLSATDIIPIYILMSWISILTMSKQSITMRLVLNMEREGS